jgi:hypothetical protein
MKRSELYKIRELIERAAASLPDDEAIEAPALFPAWAVGKAYTVGERVAYSGKLYKVLQAHTSQADWTPDVAVSLFAEVAKPGEIPVWKQPTGAQDAYNIGDKVHYPDEAGPVYVSTVDANVWAPGVYGWEIQA